MALPFGDYGSVYSNRTERPLALRVAAMRSGPDGYFDGTIYISLDERRDQVIGTATYDRKSETIWLPKGAGISAVFVPGFTTGNNAAFVLHIFDPADVLASVKGGADARFEQLFILRMMANRANLPVTQIGRTLSVNNYLSMGGWA